MSYSLHDSTLRPFLAFCIMSTANTRPTDSSPTHPTNPFRNMFTGKYSKSSVPPSKSMESKMFYYGCGHWITLYRIIKFYFLKNSLPMNNCPFPFSCRSFPGEAPVIIWPSSTFNVAVCSVLYETWKIWRWNLMCHVAIIFIFLIWLIDIISMGA